MIDTGPLVAIVRKREKWHSACVATLQQLHAPLLTCWPVLTEAAWLLRTEPQGMRVIGGLLKSGAIALVELDDVAFHWTVAFLI